MVDCESKNEKFITDTNNLEKCGAIFWNTNDAFVICCKFCFEWFTEFDEFISHVKKMHLKKSKTALETTDNGHDNLNVDRYINLIEPMIEVDVIGNVDVKEKYIKYDLLDTCILNEKTALNTEKSINLEDSLEVSYKCKNCDKVFRSEKLCSNHEKKQHQLEETKEESNTIAKSTDKKKTSISIETKLDILKRLSNGERAVDIAKIYGLAATTVRSIHNRDANKIKESSKNIVPALAKQINRCRNNLMIRMESLLLMWIQNQNNTKTKSLSKKQIQIKAKFIFDKLKLQPEFNSHQKETFVASKGWFKRFLNRTNLNLHDKTTNKGNDEATNKDGEDLEKLIENEKDNHEIVSSELSIKKIDMYEKNENSSKEFDSNQEILNPEDIKMIFEDIQNSCDEDSQNKNETINIKQDETAVVSKSLECKYCHRKFNRRDVKRNHELIHTGETPYKCRHNDCEQSFRSTVARLHHEFLHKNSMGPDVKPFVCEICNKKFRVFSSLRRHKNIHLDTKNHPFKCELCDKIFIDKTTLTEHIQRHKGEIKYTCTYCNKGFVRNNERVRHEQTHTGHKPFLCTSCGKAFYTKTKLDEHFRRHIGLRLHECDVCKKKFFSKKELTAHKISHLDTKPFTCEICFVKFSTRKGFKSHIQGHSDKPNHTCLVCKKDFKKTQSYRNHMKQHSVIFPSSGNV